MMCPAMSALGHKRTFAVQKGMSALPPIADMCSATWDVCFGPKRTSANKLRSCPTCFSWAVLQALELADDARITFTIALHGKHAREMLVEDSHRYHSISHGWGPLIIRTTGKMPSRPSPRRARAGVQGNLPWNAATTGHYLRPILSRSLGGSYMGTRSAQGTFVANRPL